MTKLNSKFWDKLSLQAAMQSEDAFQAPSTIEEGSEIEFTYATDPRALENPEGWETKTGALREKATALPYDLVPFQEIAEAFARVAEMGARKYAPWNWSLGLARVQLLCSLLRHAFAYLRGEDRDKESGLSHTDHILWNAVVLTHNVHWNLEDGRRGEPERTYKKIEG